MESRKVGEHSVEIHYVDKDNEWFVGREWARGLQHSGKIYILKEYRNDKAILAHELKHAEQYFKYKDFNYRYTFDRDFRYKMELEAYGETIKSKEYTSKRQVRWIADALVKYYGAPKSHDDIVNDLSKFLSVKKEKAKKSKALIFLIVALVVVLFMAYGLSKKEEVVQISPKKARELKDSKGDFMPKLFEGRSG